MIYYVRNALSENLVGVRSSRHGTQLFVARKLRKPKQCATCGEVIPAKSEAFGEATSCAMNRADRVHRQCLKWPVEVEVEVSS